MKHLRYIKESESKYPGHPHADILDWVESEDFSDMFLSLKDEDFEVGIHPRRYSVIINLTKDIKGGNLSSSVDSLLLHHQEVHSIIKRIEDSGLPLSSIELNSWSLTDDDVKSSLRIKFSLSFDYPETKSNRK